MKLNRNTIVIPLVALMLVGAAGAVLATTGNPTTPDVQAPAAATPTPAPSSGMTTKPAFKDDILTGVLDDLVANNTITTAQKTAILDSLTAERTARQEARKAARDKAMADRQQIRDFLSDGVITKEEFAELPADSPLRQITTLMDDGQITTDELKTLGRGFLGRGGLLPGARDGHGFRGFGGFGGGHGWDGGAAPSASPTTAG